MISCQPMDNIMHEGDNNTTKEKKKRKGASYYILLDDNFHDTYDGGIGFPTSSEYLVSYHGGCSTIVPFACKSSGNYFCPMCFSRSSQKKIIFCPCALFGSEKKNFTTRWSCAYASTHSLVDTRMQSVKEGQKKKKKTLIWHLVGCEIVYGSNPMDETNVLIWMQKHPSPWMKYPYPKP
jgi:hypothetical protein